MKRILLLGGTGEGLRLAKACAGLPVRLVYSVAGLTRPSVLPWEIRSGGFGGEAGLSHYLRKHQVELLLDATHPYAVNISRHAQRAAKATGCPAWGLRRPPWPARPEDDWRIASDWDQVVELTKPFGTVLFTLGREPLARVKHRPEGQRWIARTLTRAPATFDLELIHARGPFSLEDELALLTRLGVEVLVSKNSGGLAVSPKLDAARALGIPVVMLKRPSLPALDREFHDVEETLAALRQWVRTCRSTNPSCPRCEGSRPDL